jgi:hypothetical protein
MGKDTSTCFGCAKKFTKNDSSVQCTVCGLWIHRICADMSVEVFDLIAKQKQQSGITYWACRPCTVYAQGMNHRFRQIEEELKEVKQSAAGNTESIKQLEKKVDEIAVEVQKNEGMSKAEFEARMREEKDEARERKDRELNVIMHGVEECAAEVTDSEERRSWDLQQCSELLGLREDNIKFCRRVGPKGERDRPLVIGLYNIATRTKVLRMEFDGGISAGPDLTKKQREEEMEIWKEMEEKNKGLTAKQK